MVHFKRSNRRIHMKEICDTEDGWNERKKSFRIKSLDYDKTLIINLEKILPMKTKHSLRHHISVSMLSTRNWMGTREIEREAKKKLLKSIRISYQINKLSCDDWLISQKHTFAFKLFALISSKKVNCRLVFRFTFWGDEHVKDNKRMKKKDDDEEKEEEAAVAPPTVQFH